jgi:hypothetical protein
MKPFTKNHISSSKNALKLAYSKVQLQKFSGGNTPNPHFKREGRGDPPRHFTLLAGLMLTSTNSLSEHDKVDSLISSE